MRSSAPVKSSASTAASSTVAAPKSALVPKSPEPVNSLKNKAPAVASVAAVEKPSTPVAAVSAKSNNAPAWGGFLNFKSEEKRAEPVSVKAPKESLAATSATPASPAKIVLPPKISAASTPKADGNGAPVSPKKNNGNSATVTSSKTNSNGASTPTFITGAVKSRLDSFVGGNSAQFDSFLVQYETGEYGPEGLYAKLIKAVGSKEVAYSILPDLIGTLPRGPAKSALNTFYQTQA